MAAAEGPSAADHVDTFQCGTVLRPAGGFFTPPPPPLQQPDGADLFLFAASSQEPESRFGFCFCVTVALGGGA